MQLPGLCVSCGRTIDTEFVHCPWCGVSQINGSLVPVGAPNQKQKMSYGQTQNLHNNDRLALITKSLDDLDRDLSVFVLRMKEDL